MYHSKCKESIPGTQNETVSFVYFQLVLGDSPYIFKEKCRKMVLWLLQWTIATKLLSKVSF